MKNTSCLNIRIYSQCIVLWFWSSCSGLLINLVFVNLQRKFRRKKNTSCFNYIIHVAKLLPQLHNVSGILFVDLERTWWRLFQKLAVCTTFDIFVSIKDTKGILRNRELKNERKKDFVDTKGLIRIHKLKDRQRNRQKKKDKQRSTQHYTEN